MVLDWFKDWIGYPAEAAGILVSGGSAANMTALACAREALLGAMSDELVAYVSDQAHSSMARAARILGFRPDQLRVLPSDDRSRLCPDVLAARWTPTSPPACPPLFVRRGRRARPTPAPSTRSRSWRRSAASAASGCTSTAPTAASRR